MRTSSLVGRLVAATVASFIGCAAHAAVLDCEINGESVNPANGSTTRGKTGIMKCVERESKKFAREEEYRNGRAVGYRKFVDFSNITHIGNYNENGNRDGEQKQFNADGVLIAHENYDNGSTSGVQIYYHPNKQVKRRSFSEARKGSLASIEYNDRGQVMQLRCAEKSLLAEDRALCGFDGKASDVTFYSAKGDVAGQGRFENGKRVSLTALATGGAVARTEEAKGDRLVTRQNWPEGGLRLETVYAGKTRESEREVAKSGQAIRETRWADGWKSEETLWYLNGQPKSKTRWEREGRQVIAKAEEYWDNGKVRVRSVRDERVGPIGLQQTYTESGALESESTYDNGKLTRRKRYKDGQLVSDDEFFEDGSRKSAR